MSVFRARRHFGVEELLLSVLGTTDHPAGRSLTESNSAVRLGVGFIAGVEACAAAVVEACAAGDVVVVLFGALLPHAATSMTSDPAMTDVDHFTTASFGRTLSNPPKRLRSMP